MGTSSGLAYVELDRTDPRSPDVSAPRALITQVSSSNALHSLATPLRLPYKANRLSIHFTAIGFRYGDQVSFSYRLLDQEEEWHSTSVDKIVYESLPPGAYTFVLKAKYNYQNVYSDPVRFSFVVVPPVWQRWWFISLTLLLLAGMLYFLIARYIQGIKNKELQKRKEQAERFATEQKIGRLRQEALNAMMNPHFISNALGAIRRYLNNHTARETDQLIADFADLIRLNLEYSRATYVPLNVTIHRLEYYLRIEQYRFDHQFQYDFLIAEEVETDDLLIPNMVIQPFVENAIWWGILPKKDQPGKIELHFKLIHEDLLEIKIIDNGIGISQSKKQDRKSKSLGIELVRQRLNLCGQFHPVEIEDILSKDGQSILGTCARLKLELAAVPFSPKQPGVGFG